MIDKRAAASSNSAMDLAEIRRRRLRQLIREYYNGVDAALARAIERQPSYISSLLTSNPKHARNLGEKIARQIEKASGVPPLWLDREAVAAAPDAPAPVETDAQDADAEELDLELLSNAIAAVDIFLARRSESLAPDKKGKLVALLYDRFALTGKPDHTAVVRYLKLVA